MYALIEEWRKMRQQRRMHEHMHRSMRILCAHKSNHTRALVSPTQRMIKTPAAGWLAAEQQICVRLRFLFCVSMSWLGYFAYTRFYSLGVCHRQRQNACLLRQTR